MTKHDLRLRHRDHLWEKISMTLWSKHVLPFSYSQSFGISNILPVEDVCQGMWTFTHSMIDLFMHTQHKANIIIETSTKINGTVW